MRRENVDNQTDRGIAYTCGLSGVVTVSKHQLVQSIAFHLLLLLTLECSHMDLSVEIAIAAITGTKPLFLRCHGAAL